MSTFPTYDELLQRSPPGSAAGVFGENDELGTLNHQTPERISAAAKECIRTGRTFTLNLPLNGAPKPPMFGRQLLEQTLVPLEPYGMVGHDDILTFNSQCSTQWDGPRHWAHQGTGLFYNNTDRKEIREPGSTKLGLHNMAVRGITGRAVLVDYKRWLDVQEQGEAKKKRETFTPIGETTPVFVEELQAALEHQGTKIQPGDVLLIRYGWSAAYYAGSAKQKDAWAKHVKHAGLENSQKALRWIWDNKIAAVASDATAFECWPPEPEALHSTLVGLWAMPIGEMFDLEALAADCAQDKRYEFFFSSVPMHVIGGVAGPANAVAIK